MDWKILQARETSEEEVEDYLAEFKEGAMDEVLQVELIDDEVQWDEESPNQSVHKGLLPHTVRKMVYLKGFSQGGGISTMTQVQRCHPLAPLSTAKISVAIAIVRAAGCEFAVKYYPSFNEAIQRIDVNDIALVMVDHSCSGYCSEADAHYCRTGNSPLCCRTDSDSLMENGYARPVEGISVAALYAGFADTVLLKTKHRQCTSGLQDVADVAVAIKAGPYDIGIVAGLQSKTVNKVSLVEQMNSKVELFSQAHGCFFPNGLTYENIAHCFGTTRLQPDQADVESHPGKSKEGLVIYSVAYVGDSCEHRFITHRPSFVGMVILYGDPNELHYRQNAFDAGEEGLEIKVHSREKGCECLDNLLVSKTRHEYLNLIRNDALLLMPAELQVLPSVRVLLLWMIRPWNPGILATLCVTVAWGQATF
jgi:hypothetical protein